MVVVFPVCRPLETKLLVPRVDAVRVLEWFRGIKQFPQAQQVAHILSHPVPVRVNGVGDLEAALQYSNHSSIDQYTGHFVTKVVEDIRLRRAFIFPREVASRIPGLRVSPVGVAVSATKVGIIHDLTMAVCLEDFVFTPHACTPHPHHVEQDGCQGRIWAGGCGMGQLHEVRVCFRGFRGGRQASCVWVAEQSRVLLPSCRSD